MHRYNVVIDTNVLVSAFRTRNDDAATVHVINLLFNRDIRILFNMDIIKEYVDVLYRKELGLDDRLIDDIMIHIIKNGKEIISNKSVIKMIDESDRKFYDIFKRDNNAYLITGNIKHYPKEKHIVSPREFVDIIEKLVKK